jgi:uncharacterized membrane protein (DUF4010 family)
VDIFQQLPPDLVKISLVLFLSFLVGLEREEHKATANSYSFGGVRTFPLIGLIGYSLALLSGNQLLPLTIGFMVVAGFLLLSYWHKLCKTETPGVTSEMSALASLLLLDLKQALENLSARIAPSEILTFAKFLVLTGVILPVLPHQEFSRFHINPFKTWLVVVAISAISYGSYVLQKLTKGRGGIELAALLGGAYSSTVTTVVMARRAAREHRPQLFAGSILIASGVMYLRLIILLALFNRQLMSLLWQPFLAFAALAIGGGWLWTRRANSNAPAVQREFEPKNPLELGTAFLFAALFLAMLILTQLAVTYLGRAGVNSLAVLMGVTDVDPFIMGMTQAAGALTPLRIAAGAVLIAAASNNLVKGIYAFSLADRKTGVQSLALLAALAILGLAPLFWLGS